MNFYVKLIFVRLFLLHLYVIVASFELNLQANIYINEVNIERLYGSYTIYPSDVARSDLKRAEILSSFIMIGLKLKYYIVLQQTDRRKHRQIYMRSPIGADSE